VEWSENSEAQAAWELRTSRQGQQSPPTSDKQRRPPDPKWILTAFSGTRTHTDRWTSIRSVEGYLFGHRSTFYKQQKKTNSMELVSWRDKIAIHALNAGNDFLLF
jgi:hypothetical protein